MSRADYASIRSAQVLLKVREAAGHPNASLLFAIGAERPSPQSAASAAYALGLTMQEEKLAKWVAVAKRDSEKLFGKPFFEALQDILKEGESTMEVKHGRVFFDHKAQPLLRKLANNLIKAGIEFSGDPWWTHNFPEISHNGLDDSFKICIKHLGIYVHKYGHNENLILGHTNFVANDTRDYDIVTDDGLIDLKIRVKSKSCMKAVCAFAKAWEAKSRQLKGGREATVTIYQDFA